MELQRSLSDLYWMNVADPTFPFVGVIEHTNFEPSTSYGGRHLAYLSKYLPDTAPLFRMSNEEVLEFTIPHLQRMFPSFRREWIVAHHVWRARFSQPVVERHYSALIPPTDTPLSHLFIATMAQVYPEDRGTNYAIRDGRGIAKRVLSTALDAGRDTSSEAEIPVPAGVA
jgi:protoporphyrinogen oxidase